jgi:hypothetical protein
LRRSSEARGKDEGTNQERANHAKRQSVAVFSRGLEQRKKRAFFQ